MKKILIIEHVPFERAGLIKKMLKDMAVESETCCLYETPSLPEINNISGIVIMGGPMGVSDTREYSWLELEKKFLKEALDADIPMLGICLGAQLIADILGAKVYKNKYKEIGVFPVQFNRDFASFTGICETLNLPVLHWHGDTFNIPEGSVNIGSSKGCLNQGFLYRKNVLALQFHLESTESSVQLLIENCQGELSETSPFIQDAIQIAKNIDKLKDNACILKSILKKLFIS